MTGANASYFAAQLEAMTRERDAYIRACDSYLEEIADLKRALDTARHDATEEAAQAPHVWRFRSPQARGWMPWMLGPAPDDLGEWLQQHEIQEVAAARQTKGQSHGA